MVEISHILTVIMCIWIKVYGKFCLSYNAYNIKPVNYHHQVFYLF